MTDKSFLVKSDEYFMITQNEDSASLNPLLVLFPKTQFYADSTTPLGISGVFNGTARDSIARYYKFRAMAVSDQASTAGGFVIQESQNGSTNWRTVASTTLAIGVPSALEASITLRYARVQLTNGATGQGTLEIGSSLSVL